jgi:signal transduction histidine kinase
MNFRLPQIFKARSFFSIIVGGLLPVIYIVSLLVYNYQNNNELQEAAIKRYSMDVEKQAATLEYFFLERKYDLRAMSDSLEIGTYLANRAMGMSELYGLKVSLFSVNQMMQETIKNKTITGLAIYKQFVFLNQDKEILTNTAVSSIHGEKVLSCKVKLDDIQDEPELILEKTDQGYELLIATPVFIKKKVSGWIVTWLDMEVLHNAFLDSPLDVSSRVLFLTLADGTILHSSNANTPDVSFESFQKEIAAVSSQSVITVTDIPGKEGSYLLTRIQIQTLPFFLTAYVKKAELRGDLAIWTFFVGVGMLFFFLMQRRELNQRKTEYSLAKAQESNQAKSEFLANMSHEIRTPMNSIIGRTRLALNHKLDDELRSHLEMISVSSENLLALINDILDFSKIEAGELAIENQPFDIHETIDACMKTINVFLEDNDKALELRYSIASDVPQAAIGDALRLRQILLNLLSNAIKFTEKGSVNLLVNIAGIDNESFQLQFSVQDTGIGIQPENLEHIFKKFSQEDDSITRKFGGTGLGLTISKQLCQLMGGDISAVSTPGIGTTFTFTLLLQPCNRSALPVEKEPVNVEHVPISPLSLLLVEDNEANRILARMVLEQENHQVIEAHDGLHGLKLLVGNSFDAVLMDVQMPVMDGLTTTRVIRAVECGDPVEGVAEDLIMELTTQLSGGHIPIIAMTANAMRGDKEECLRAGMDDYLAKPFVPEVFAAVFYRLATGYYKS